MNSSEPIHLKIIGGRDKDGRTHNLPTANEVAALIIGDIDGTSHNRDIIVETCYKTLQRIIELHPSYLALQYPLLFSYAEDGYRPDIYHKGVEIEDATDHVSGEYNVSVMGTRITLPSSYTGRPRYMKQNYLDAMAIIRAYGYPTLFITFTYNPKWLEILRYLEPLGLKPEDRLDISSRKRGLPHAHIFLFLEKTDRVPNLNDIDELICAQIPNKDEEPELYQLVLDFMMHGPCGPGHPKMPCMKLKKCSKHFPKDLTAETHFDPEGFPLYRRQDDGNFIMKSDTRLDNSIKLISMSSGVTVGIHKILIQIHKQGPGSNICWDTCSLPTFFHLPDQQPILFDAESILDLVLSKPSVGASQFIKWMTRNRNDPAAQQYTYIEFPRHYHSTLTNEQNITYETIINAIDKDDGGPFFLYGYGGTGKTFVWKMLAVAVRSRGDIVINVASSGIAALLLTGGRTAHSRFVILINVVKDSFCSIKPDSELAALLNLAKLIIWDEAPMMRRHCFETFDQTMRDIIK
ncbi:uncharacterized protein [Rutidosis leptorrhynchoides]|uniref:uncharacterized protein n=1 Tax=Rutidosis leptorrhynchoides TaxID=125765 RepID=UPI003A997839